jgi:hypothetical protein
MFKKVVFALCGLGFAIALALPPAAEAQVAVGVQIGHPVVHDTVMYQSGYHEGYYYDNGYRYQRDDRGYRHYDHAFGSHDWKHDRAHRDGNHHDKNHPDGDHRDWGHDNNHHDNGNR